MNVPVSALPALQLRRWNEYVEHGNKAGALLQQLSDALHGVRNGTASEAARFTQAAMALLCQAATDLELAEDAAYSFARLVGAELAHHRHAGARDAGG
jgi:hypothetical protein